MRRLYPSLDFVKTRTPGIFELRAVRAALQAITAAKLRIGTSQKHAAQPCAS